ncbi:Lrp/AsnC family transcriptional regulator [Halomicrobium urmianum]|uniref:Lrp/AsnC family transcriptional regulator n=1 Tax=Halomicrobium urmianum TaxID=1586233 RepID=UPI001CDA530F|nr:winged helix-turn-helix transcriptional regulator [Halomicrobium urmianum]
MAELDEVDYGILHLLQSNARDQTPVDMAESLPVSAQTVRNRIEKLEERGVIEGYVPVIDYEEAGFPMRVKFACTAPVGRRTELAREALEISNVVRVEEMLSARRNLHPLAVARNADEITAVTQALDDLGLRIESERLLRTHHHRPFNHFGEDDVSNE